MPDSQSLRPNGRNILSPVGRSRRYPPGPLFTCVSTANEPFGIQAVTLDIEATWKLSLADMAVVGGALGPVLERIAVAIAAGEYQTVVENPNFPEVVRFHGPDGRVFPHWGMAMDGGFISSVGIRRSGLRRSGELGDKP